MKTFFALVIMIVVAAGGAAYAGYFEFKTPVAFYKGHSHDEMGNTIGAPQHSGGTDSNGCHNASVPYHCH